MQGLKDNAEQVAPHSVEAERAVLGSVLQAGTPIFEKVGGWIRNTDAFYLDLHRKIWDACVELYKIHNPIDIITINSKIRETHKGMSVGYELSGMVDDIVSVSRADVYAKIVWEKYIQRQISKSAYELYSMSYDEYSVVSARLDSHMRLIGELQDLAPSRKQDIADIVSAAVESIKDKTNVIRYGIPQLDKPAGGMTRKEITVLGGRPGHGKTTLMINIVRTLIEQDYKVMVFNREMSNTEMMNKIFVMEADLLSYSDLREKHNENNESIVMKEVKDVASHVDKKYKKLLMYDDVRTLDESLRELGKEKPDVVLDDYIQLIKVDGGFDGRRFEIERIMNEYKWACKRYNCSAFLLSQLNRAIEMRADPRPRMSDYSESGVIEQTAETALFLWYGYNFDDSAYDKNEADVIAAKSRYGQVGTYTIGFSGDKCKYYNTVEEAQASQRKSLLLD
tara:strand:- start:3961 stop:5313 length:1353 start_codon:yes stop_codon:yes gene_type:complete